MHQHSTTATGRIVNSVTRDWVKNADECINHLGRGEEFAGLGAGIVGKLLDQVFVGPAKDVGRDSACTTSLGISGLPLPSGAG